MLSLCCISDLQISFSEVLLLYVYILYDSKRRSLRLQTVCYSVHLWVQLQIQTWFSVFFFIETNSSGQKQWLLQHFSSFSTHLDLHVSGGVGGGLVGPSKHASAKLAVAHSWQLHFQTLIFQDCRLSAATWVTEFVPNVWSVKTSSVDVPNHQHRSALSSSSQNLHPNPNYSRAPWTVAYTRSLLLLLEYMCTAAPCLSVHWEIWR